jgi:hypothetical protein
MPSLRRRPRTAPSRSPSFDPAESPLAWLALRRGRDGQPFLDAVEVEAGERLRADLTRSGILPRTTTDWSRIGTGTSAGSRVAMSFPEALIAARQRVTSALEAAGPDFAGLLVDVCGFLKGLETVEHERQWPARTAKVVLRLALRQLARHYGLQARAEGPRKAAMRAWGAADFRPTIDGGEGA